MEQQETCGAPRVIAFLFLGKSALAYGAHLALNSNEQTG
jgi:hypothetical protein